MDAFDFDDLLDEEGVQALIVGAECEFAKL